jgi:hypothetical protein
MGLNNIKINNTTNVKTGVVYDISKVTGQSYETLSDALGTDGKNVPLEVREGGMSVRFVTSDGKYVQYMLKEQSFTTDTTEWMSDTDNIKKEVGFTQVITAHGNNYDEFLITPLKQGETVHIKTKNSPNRYTIAFTNTVPYTDPIQIVGQEGSSEDMDIEVTAEQDWKAVHVYDNSGTGKLQVTIATGIESNFLEIESDIEELNSQILEIDNVLS